MTRNGGGWTTIQRRMDGSVDFYRNWQEYKQGFGNAEGEYWIGLENIHQITNYFSNVMIRISATAFDGEEALLIFEKFSIENEKNLYKLRCGTFFEGNNAYSSSWKFVCNEYFSTPDRDNDKSHMNCAEEKKSGNWFRECSWLSFNGPYSSNKNLGYSGLYWKDFKWAVGLKDVSLSIKIKEH